MKNSHLIILAHLASLFCTHAQEAPERNCRIVLLDRPADAPKTIHLYDGTTSQEVDLPGVNLSPLYKLAPGAIQLRLLSAKADDPKTVSPDAPSIEIPRHYTDFYLLLSSDPKNKIIPIKLKVINLESENFKLGQAMWINDTDNIIKAELGEQTVSLGPHSSKIVDSPLSNQRGPASGYYIAKFAYQPGANAAVTAITEQSWWHDANSRHLGFIINKGGRLPEIYFYRDFRNPM